jgi:2-keto-3-deoxy-L-rhamnonate aldolase RhmA
VRKDFDDSRNPMVRKLSRNEAVLCMPLRISRLPHVVHMAAANGFDSIYVDMEHSAIGLDDVSTLSLAAAGVGVVPLVRVPSHDPYYIGRVLEGGAAGIIAPHVDSAADARNVVDASLFPPLGKRALAGAGVAFGYTQRSVEDVQHDLNANTIVIAMVESTTAIANADEIAAVEGIDLLLVGTGDLTEELGIAGQHRHPLITAAYDRVADACRRHGKWLGVAGIKGQSTVLAELYRLGARFVSARNDESLLIAAVREESANLRGLFADGRAVQESRTTANISS